MSWNGNKATVSYRDEAGEEKKLEVEGTFGDLDVRFLQAVPATLGTMPFRMEIYIPAGGRTAAMVVTDVTDLQANGDALRQLADRIYRWVTTGEALVTFRNGSGTKRMELTGISVERVGSGTVDEAAEPPTNGAINGFTDEAGLRSEF